MTTAREIQARLKAPFPRKDLEWRVGPVSRDKASGMMLPYVTARAVMDRLDEVVGPTGWYDEVHAVERAGSKGWTCTLTLIFPEEGEGGVHRTISHEDGADETAIEPTKGGISDALKRAAVKFGIGRYLYNLDPQWAPGEVIGGHFRASRRWVPDLPAWALPEGEEGEATRPPESPPVERSRQKAPQPKPQPSRPAQPKQAPAQSMPAREDFPPGDPPFDISADIRFGKYKGRPWGWLACGSENGDRHSYLNWYIYESDVSRKNNPPNSYKQARALLEWMEMGWTSAEEPAAQRAPDPAGGPADGNSGEAAEQQDDFLEGAEPAPEGSAMDLDGPAPF